MDEKTRRRIGKLYALSERGEGGEKETAKKFLATLLAREKLTIETFVQQTQVELHFFQARNPLQKKLLLQLVSYFYPQWDGSYNADTKSPGKLWIAVPSSVKIEIDVAFLVLWGQLEKKIDQLFTAFIHVNQLFPEKPTSDGAPVDLASREMDELKEIVQFAGLIKPASLGVAQLEKKDNESQE